MWFFFCLPWKKSYVLDQRKFMCQGVTTPLVAYRSIINQYVKHAFVRTETDDERVSGVSPKAQVMMTFGIEATWTQTFTTKQYYPMTSLRFVHCISFRSFSVLFDGWCVQTHSNDAREKKTQLFAFLPQLAQHKHNNIYHKEILL